MAISKGLRLLYGLTKEKIKKMKSRDLEDITYRLDGSRGENMGKTAQDKLRATTQAINEEKSLRAVRDQEYGVMQDELRGASELMPVKPPTGGGGGGIDDLKRAYTGIFTEVGDTARAYTGIARGKGTDAGDLGRAYKGIFTGKGDEVIPEFSSKNLAMKEIENGVPSGNTLDPRAGYMGPKISTEGNPLALKDITFGQLDETGKGVYSAVKESGIEEFSDPGVLADVLDYARRAGRGRAPNEIVSEYWNKNGNNIRTYLDDIKSGMGPDGPQPGQQMDLFLD